MLAIQPSATQGIGRRISAVTRSRNCGFGLARSATGSGGDGGNGRIGAGGGSATSPNGFHSVPHRAHRVARPGAKAVSGTSYAAAQEGQTIRIVP